MKKSLTSQPELAGILPRETQGQKKLFELLDYAYIGARYHDDYKITPQELKYLARCACRALSVIAGRTAPRPDTNQLRSENGEFCLATEGSCNYCY